MPYGRFDGFAAKRRRQINLALFEKMPADQLREYIAFLLWHYRVVDAFWFLNVAERFDPGAVWRENEDAAPAEPASSSLPA